MNQQHKQQLFIGVRTSWGHELRGPGFSNSSPLSSRAATRARLPGFPRAFVDAVARVEAAVLAHCELVSS